MNILITGAAGFVGGHLTAALEAIRDGKDRRFSALSIGKLYLYDVDTPERVLEEGCQNADFVFHLAGVNRAEGLEEYMEGNYGAAVRLLEGLRRYGNRCPVMAASSVQATLEGRYDGPYGRSKRAGEELFLDYGAQTGARVLVYRFTNLFGKWGRPNYNSVVATFCHNYARDLPITVHDPETLLELCYIDDVVEELIGALLGREHREGRFCVVPVTHKVTLGEIVELLERFKSQPKTLLMPEIPDGSFAKKLYATYVSYLPPEKVRFPLKMNVDERGSFTELMRTAACGQFSVNVTKPGVTKGQHWHNSKWELFMVVSGRALIRMRRLGSDAVLRFEVSGERIEVVHMLPGYTHSITNLSDREDLVTLMWASECFDPQRPDTYFEEVE